MKSFNRLLSLILVVGLVLDPVFASHFPSQHCGILQSSVLTEALSPAHPSLYKGEIQPRLKGGKLLWSRIEKDSLPTRVTFLYSTTARLKDFVQNPSVIVVLGAIGVAAYKIFYGPAAHASSIFLSGVAPVFSSQSPRERRVRIALRNHVFEAITTPDGGPLGADRQTYLSSETDFVIKRPRSFDETADILKGWGADQGVDPKFFDEWVRRVAGGAERGDPLIGSHLRKSKGIYQPLLLSNVEVQIRDKEGNISIHIFEQAYVQKKAPEVLWQTIQRLYREGKSKDVKRVLNAYISAVQHQLWAYGIFDMSTGYIENYGVEFDRAGKPTVRSFDFGEFIDHVEEDWTVRSFAQDDILSPEFWVRDWPLFGNLAEDNPFGLPANNQYDHPHAIKNLTDDDTAVWFYHRLQKEMRPNVLKKIWRSKSEPLGDPAMNLPLASIVDDIARGRRANDPAPLAAELRRPVFTSAHHGNQNRVFVSEGTDVVVRIPYDWNTVNRTIRSWGWITEMAVEWVEDYIDRIAAGTERTNAYLPQLADSTAIVPHVTLRNVVLRIRYEDGRIVDHHFAKVDVQRRVHRTLRTAIAELYQAGDREGVERLLNRWIEANKDLWAHGVIEPNPTFLDNWGIVEDADGDARPALFDLGEIIDTNVGDPAEPFMDLANWAPKWGPILSDDSSSFKSLTDVALAYWLLNRLRIELNPETVNTLWRARLPRYLSQRNPSSLIVAEAA